MRAYYLLLPLAPGCTPASASSLSPRTTRNAARLQPRSAKSCSNR